MSVGKEEILNTFVHNVTFRLFVAEYVFLHFKFAASVTGSRFPKNLSQTALEIVLISAEIL